MSIAAVEESQPSVQEMPLERVEAELCTLAGQIAAANCRFLTLLADFDVREGWAGWGVHSCAHWLSWRCGLSLHAAQEQVRVAHALADLPRIRQAFGQGRISFSKVRAICRVANSDNEEDLLHVALHNPAAHVERLVRGLRKAERNRKDDDRRRASGGERSGASVDEARAGVQWRWDDDGDLRIWGKLTSHDGARLLAALSRMDQERRRTDEAPSDQSHHRGGGQVGSAEPTCPQDRSLGEVRVRTKGSVAGVAPADLGPALVAAADLLCTELDAPVHAPAADVVVHVDAGTLVDSARRDSAAGESARPARIDDGPAVRDSVLQMLACDGRVQLAVDAADGRTLDLGRRRRRPSRRQLDALWRRDRGCAHPGCGRTRFLHAHHVTPWAAGGRTDLDNLVLLCGEHHRHLHDGGFTVVALGRQRFRFLGPRGAVRPPAPKMFGDRTRLTQAYPDIKPGTIEPDWDGSPLHLAHAVDVFVTGWAIQAARGNLAETSPPPEATCYPCRQTKTAVPGTNRPR